MPVGLDRVRAPARRPERPRMLLWLGVLGLFLAVGMGATVLFATQALREQPLVFWRVALGVPLLGWAILGFGRVVLYAGQHSAADGWDEAREIDLIRKIRRGRRSLQVLGVSLSTALHDPQQPALGKAPGLTAQADTPDESPVRHTRLPATDLTREQPAIADTRWASRLAGHDRLARIEHWPSASRAA